MDTYRPTWLEISLTNLHYNYNTIRTLVGDDVKIGVVVKANGYGHGAVEISKACLKAGAAFLLVATLGEGMELRHAGITSPILILGWTPEECYEEAIQQEMRMTLYNIEEAKRLNAKAHTMGKKAYVHLKVDTGMSRIGFQADATGVDTAEAIMQMDDLIVEGLFSHFSKADEADKTFAHNQFALFQQFEAQLRQRTGVRIPIQHISNSAAIIDMPEAHLDLVRPGIMLYGFQPSSEMAHIADVRPVLSWKARLGRVQWLPAGRLIGYNGTFELKQDTLVATVPAGYADGYNRLLSNRGYVVCRGKKLPILGRVCMDQFMVDASQLPDLQAGDEVTLLGEDQGASITVGEMAAMLNTIEHEVICDISVRVPRIYLQEK